MIAFSSVVLVVSIAYLNRSDSEADISNESEDTHEIFDLENPSRGHTFDGVHWDPESEFCLRYGSDDTTIEEDLEIIEAILEQAVVLVKGFSALPLADNRDFTKLFTGGNKQRFAWIHPEHPSVNQEGELVDRFGAPLFFHRTSAFRTEVRSAGEDRLMWTKDDVFSNDD